MIHKSLIQNIRIREIAILLFLVVSFSFGCSKDESTNACDSENDTQLPNGICLSIDDDQSIDAFTDQLIEVISSSMQDIQNAMPSSNIRIEVANSPQQIIPEIGLGGYTPFHNKVLIYIDPDFFNLEISIENELPPLLAHEIHHAKRNLTVGYGNTLLKAMISEGLADHFSQEIYGIDPPIWSVVLSEQEILDWLEVAEHIWDQTDYNHADWFFGNGNTIPRWAGYSIGYYLVDNYLQVNPNETASILHNKPASAFVP